MIQICSQCKGSLEKPRIAGNPSRWKCRECQKKKRKAAEAKYNEGRRLDELNRILKDMESRALRLAVAFDTLEKYSNSLLESMKEHVIFRETVGIPKREREVVKNEAESATY
jgi:exonuclease VII small subunit